VAGEAFGDAMMGFYVANGSTGAGLRGGTFVGHGWPQVRLKLKKVRWVGDAIVWGKGTWDIDTGKVAATLTVRGPDGVLTHLTLTWSENRPLATARIAGATDVILRFPAP